MVTSFLRLFRDVRRTVPPVGTVAAVTTVAVTAVLPMFFNNAKVSLLWSPWSSGALGSLAPFASLSYRTAIKNFNNSSVSTPVASMSIKGSDLGLLSFIVHPSSSSNTRRQLSVHQPPDLPPGAPFGTRSPWLPSFPRFSVNTGQRTTPLGTVQ